MLVNEAEIDVRETYPDLVFACVTVTVQPSVAQLEKRLTVVSVTILYCQKLIGRCLNSGHK